MSGDIAFDRICSARSVLTYAMWLYMIDKWGKCPRLIEELKLVK